MPPRGGRRPASPAPGRSRRPARPPEPPPASSLLVVEEVAGPGELDQHPEQQPATCVSAASAAAATAPRADEGAGAPRAGRGRTAHWPVRRPPLRRRGPAGQPVRAYAVAGQVGALGGRSQQSIASAAQHRASRAFVRHRDGPRSRAAPSDWAVAASPGQAGRHPDAASARCQVRAEPAGSAAARRMRPRRSALPGLVPGRRPQQRVRKVRTTPACSSTPAASSRHRQDPGRVRRARRRSGSAPGRGWPRRAGPRPSLRGQAGELLVVQVPKPSGNWQRRGQRGRAGALHRGEHPTALEQASGLPAVWTVSRSATTGAKSRPSSGRRRRTTVHEVAGLRSPRWPVPDRGPTAGSAGR